MANTTAVQTGWLVADSDHIYEDHALVCEDGIVVDIVPNTLVAGLPGQVGAHDAIVCPGFVNAHNHMYNIATRGIRAKRLDPSLSLKPMLEQWWWPEIEDKVTHEQIEVSTRYSAYELMKNGVTCVNDILEAPNSAPGCLAVEAAILERAGIRAVLSLESSERLSRKNGRLCLQENIDFILAQRASQSRVRGMQCVHTTFSCSKPFLQEARASAREIGAMIQLHCSEGADEGRYCVEDHQQRPVELYDSIGFLDRDVLLGQCVVMEERELDLMRQHDVSCAHQPISNCAYGCGISPVPEMLARDLRVGLGTDGYLNDYFEVMRMAFFLQKGARSDAGVMSACTVLDMATRLGSTAIGYEGIGSLLPGSQADFLIVHSDLPTPLTNHNVIEQFLLRHTSADIRSVFCAGECIYENGVATGFDSRRAVCDMLEFTKDVWR